MPKKIKIKNKNIIISKKKKIKNNYKFLSKLVFNIFA